MFLRAGWKAGLSNFWAWLVFKNLEAQDEQEAVKTCTGGEGAASWVSALPKGAGRGQRRA